MECYQEKLPWQISRIKLHDQQESDNNVIRISFPMTAKIYKIE